MKKLILLTIALMAMSFLSATPISYYGGITSYITVPYDSGQGWFLNRIAVVFEPSDACVLNYVNIVFYAAQTTGGNAMAELRPFVNGMIDETGFPSTAVTVANADLVYYAGGNEVTTFDFSSYPESARSFAAGEKFAIVLSCPNGVMNTVDIAPMGSTDSAGHSWVWYSDETPNWVLRTNVEWAIAADVTYAGPFIDLEATSLYFTGDMFLQPEDGILYEADVTNNSEIAVTGDVKVEVLDQATGTALWTQTWLNQNFPVSTEPVHFTCTAPPVVAYPATAGDYQVKLTVTMPGNMDMVNTNNMTDLEQITFSPPGNMDYINDADTATPSNAYVWNADGVELGVDFWYYAAPLTLQTVGFRVWDSSWPANAATNANLKYAIYNWVDGLPNLLYVTPDPVPCTLGQWNDYDVSALGLNFAAGESFMVAYKQVNASPNCPGLCFAESAPQSGWISSYFWDPTDQTWYLGYDEDMMIRAGVIETVTGVEAPIISVAMDSGYPTITWQEVTGAQSYNIYGSNDPTAAQPWTAIETGVGDLGYAYMGTAPYQFFYVTASTEADGTKMALPTQLKPARASKEKAIRGEAPNPITRIIQATVK
jgi:hypothetical protein